jgi:hypothetical protein
VSSRSLISLAIRAALRAARSSDSTDDGVSPAWRRRRVMEPVMVAQIVPDDADDLLLEFQVRARHVQVVLLGAPELRSTFLSRTIECCNRTR